ncbi:hypothetical protein GLA29479_3143 [Lysobacter antibioticus]|nr:hypothetical protein GLA29479_3143 [Lysobacter antibioticus]
MNPERPGPAGAFAIRGRQRRSGGASRLGSFGSLRCDPPGPHQAPACVADQAQGPASAARLLSPCPRPSPPGHPAGLRRPPPRTSFVRSGPRPASDPVRSRAIVARGGQSSAQAVGTGRGGRFRAPGPTSDVSTR